MKLFFHKTISGNFGDDLNEWLWPKIFGSLEEVTSADWLVGIGTIPDERLLAIEGTKLIVGSGYRPSEWKPSFQEDWKILFVRGPLTAEKYGLDDRFSISDPALLVGEYWNSKLNRTSKVGFIPHYYTRNLLDCEKICSQVELKFIDPCWTVEKILEEIGELDRIIVEAMHGAIVADALGIPWIRVRILSWKKESSTVSEFKWADWAQSVQVNPVAQLDANIPVRFGRGANVINSILSMIQESLCRKVLLSVKNSNGYQLSPKDTKLELISKMHAVLHDAK